MTNLLTETVVIGVVCGIVATLTIDGFSVALKMFSLPTANWGLVGRWCFYCLKGQFIHNPVSETSPVKGELKIGWSFHYLVGAVYGVGFILLSNYYSGPSWATGLVFGLTTLAAPWFILQPGLGIGVFASKANNPLLIRSLNVLVHGLFGLSLYFAWWLMAYFLGGF